MNRSVLLLTISIAITACKIEVSVPEGGRVDASSGNYICTVDQTCEIDVVDLFFDETFIATPEAGYEFRGWRKEARHFCGGLSGNCRLQTAWFESFDVLTSFLESDGVFYLRPLCLIENCMPLVAATTICSGRIVRLFTSRQKTAGA